jgi:hypothetical protein
MAFGGVLLGCAAWAQDVNRITVPFHDPSKPRFVNVDVFNGTITVRGYNGNEVIVESTGGHARRDRNVPEGMHRIGPSAGPLDISEDNNIMNIRAGVMGASDVNIQVPSQTSLKLRSVAGGKILVEGVSGDIDAQNMNGAVTITNVSGSVLANSMNGRVTVSLDRVTPNKAMSFSSMNGTIDVTLPADTKANLKMKSDNGEIYSDFDIKLTGNAGNSTVVEDSRRAPRPPAMPGAPTPPTPPEPAHGRYRVRVDRTMMGTINGGGPEMQFVTFNGNILIHKK